MSDKPRLEYLDAVRGLAITMVIVNHCGSLVGVSGAAGKATSLLAYGVQLFFVISAFTVFMTYSSAKSAENNAVGNFFIRRLLRLFPVYWAGILIYSAVYGLDSRGWLDGPELWHIPLHLALLNVWHPMAQSSVVPGGWSISVELAFYFLVPLIFMTVTSLNKALAFVAVAFVIGPIVVNWISLQIPFENYPSLMVKLFWQRNLLNQLGCFAVGITVFFAIRSGWSRLARSRGGALALLMFMVAAFVLGLRIRTSVPLPIHFVAMAFGAMIILLSEWPLRIFVNQLTTFVGRVSYSAYLLHFLVLKQVNDYLPENNSLMHFGILLIIAFPLTLLLAWISFHMVEKPSISLAKNIIDRRRRASSIAR